MKTDINIVRKTGEIFKILSKEYLLDDEMFSQFVALGLSGGDFKEEVFSKLKTSMTLSLNQ